MPTYEVYQDYHFWVQFEVEADTPAEAQALVAGIPVPPIDTDATAIQVADPRVRYVDYSSDYEQTTVYDAHGNKIYRPWLLTEPGDDPDTYDWE